MAKDPHVFIVLLRRPKPGKPRDDPFWESGSFGCTGCHNDNLLSVGSTTLRNGDRLAFAQGGDRGTRLVLLTPPITIVRHVEGLEVTWDPSVRPFKYTTAPILVRNGGTSDFPAIPPYVAACKRPTAESRFASKFRGRTQALEPGLATELTTVSDRLRSRAGADSFAMTYTETMPWFLAVPDLDRARTYGQLRRDMGVRASASRCALRSCRS
jgi:hypothetical protein